MREQLLAALTMLVGGAAVANPQENWISLVSADIRIAAPFEIKALTASADGWWLLDGGSFLHRYVAGEIEPVMDAVSIDFFNETRLYGTPSDGVLLLGTFNSCSSWDSECATSIESRDDRGERNWLVQAPGRCGAPGFEADGEFRLSCGGRLYRYSAEGEQISVIGLFGSQMLLDSDHLELPDGGALLVARKREAVTAVVALDSNDQPRWRAQFPNRSAAPVFTDDHLYLRFPGASAATSELVVLRASDGVETGRTTVGGVITAVQGWQDRIWIGLADATGQHRLLAVDPRGATTGMLELGSYRVQTLGVTVDLARNHGLLLGLDGDLPSLGRLDASGSYRQSALGSAARFGHLSALPAGKVVVSSVPLQAGLQTRQVEVLDIANQRIGARLTRLPAWRDRNAQQTIDTERAEMWSAGIRGSPYIARHGFDGSAPTVHEFGDVIAPRVALVQGPPVRIENHYCAAIEDPAQVFCAPLAAGDDAFNFALPFIESEAIVAMAADDDGRLAILSQRRLSDLSSQLTRTVVSASGVVQGASSIVPGRGFLSLGGLRGLVGQRLFVDGEQTIVNAVAPSRRLRNATGLPDSGAILATAEDNGDGLTAARLERIDAAGVRLWEVDLPPPLLVQSHFLRLETAEDILLVEPSFPVEDPQRVLFDLRDGALLATEPAFNDGSSWFINEYVPAGRLSNAFWRLSETCGGFVAQRISDTDPKVHIWLPRHFSLRDAITGADGKVYFDDFGPVLGVADLNGLAASAPAPSGLAAERLHVDGVQVRGLVSGPGVGGSRYAAYQFDQTVDVEGGRTRSQWWHIEPAGRGERTLDLDRRKPLLQPANESFSISQLPHQISLLPLVGPAWLLKQRTDYAGDPRLVRQLQAHPTSAATRLYFASDDHWIGLDEPLGEAVWGLPNGHWYRLQRQPSGRWAVFAGAEARIDEAADVTAALGFATLSRQGCGRLDLQLRSIAPAARWELGGELGRASSFQASCR